MTYPEAAASSDAAALRSRTKLLVEADDLMDAVLANLALKLFILLRVEIKIAAKHKLRVHSKI